MLASVFPLHKCVVTWVTVEIIVYLVVNWCMFRISQYSWNLEVNIHISPIKIVNWLKITLAQISKKSYIALQSPFQMNLNHSILWISSPQMIVQKRSSSRSNNSNIYLWSNFWKPNLLKKVIYTVNFLMCVYLLLLLVSSDCTFLCTFCCT